MSPIIRSDEQSVKDFIYGRALGHAKFRTVIAVKVQGVASEFDATVWVGQQPDSEMIQYLYSLENELRDLGISCSIVVKSDKELPFGGKYPLRTSKGDFVYRYYRIDAVKDEDFVYVFSLTHGPNTYRFRVSLTRTLASMLLSRAAFEEGRILDVYLEEIKRSIEEKEVKSDQLYEIMLGSRDVGRFVTK